MTTKPKGKKYRIRRSGSLAEPLNKPASTPRTSTGANTAQEQLFESPEDGFGDEPFATASQTKGSQKSTTKGTKDGKAEAAELASIEKEGLTGRQLRMARRVALKHGLEPKSDYDAIRLLRAKGIDPFQRAAMLDLVEPKDKKTELKTNLPKKVEKAKLPSTEVLDDDSRANAIARIQRDIATRRRHRTMMLFSRLAFFVFLPTFLVGLYYYNFATPLYATKSEFLIQKAESGGSALGGLFSGTGFANSQDSITVQSYLQSREAMLRLDKDLGFKSHFAQDFVDPLQRLEEDSTNEAAYRLYKKMVKIGFDPTEGLLKMEVIAGDPQVSEQFARALIAYAEEQVDNLTQRLRGDQMQGANDSFEDAEAKMLAAQKRVLKLQESLGVIDAATETASIMGQVATFETQIREKELQLQQLLDNARPNQARVDGVRGDISRLRALVAELRGQLTNEGGGATSLAQISGELKIAEIDLETRQMLMQQALQQLETARIEANRQVRYLSLGVSPVAPDEPTYPRKFENTLVAFLIFSGLYLMASLTASILREQVSA